MSDTCYCPDCGESKEIKSLNISKYGLMTVDLIGGHSVTFRLVIEEEE